jgi:hypothetical protein
MKPRNLFLAEAAAFASLAFLASCSGTTAVHTPIRTFQMGQHVEVMPLVYAVFEKQWLAQLGSGSNAILPRNRFLTIRLTVTSGAGGESYVPPLTLVDDAGKTCDEITTGEAVDAVPRWIGSLRAIKPADTLEGNVLFDCVPRHYRLKLTSEENRAAYVEIPLSFESEGPGVELLPKNDKNERTGDLSHPR